MSFYVFLHVFCCILLLLNCITLFLLFRLPAHLAIANFFPRVCFLTEWSACPRLKRNYRRCRCMAQIVTERWLPKWSWCILFVLFCCCCFLSASLPTCPPCHNFFPHVLLAFVWFFRCLFPCFCLLLFAFGLILFCFVCLFCCLFLLVFAVTVVCLFVCLFHCSIIWLVFFLFYFGDYFVCFVCFVNNTHAHCICTHAHI